MKEKQESNPGRQSDDRMGENSRGMANLKRRVLSFERNAQLKPLMNAVNTIPCSTAECERGFSSMNIIVTNLRSDLLVQDVSALMFIMINGPSSSIWKAEKICYVLAVASPIRH